VICLPCKFGILLRCRQQEMQLYGKDQIGRFASSGKLQGSGKSIGPTIGVMLQFVPSSAPIGKVAIQISSTTSTIHVLMVGTANTTTSSGGRVGCIGFCCERLRASRMLCTHHVIVLVGLLLPIMDTVLYRDELSILCRGRRRIHLFCFVVLVSFS
jgi:hypothetical protein